MLTPGGVWFWGVPAPRRVWSEEGACLFQGVVSQHTLRQTPPCGQTDRCKNITFATLLGTVNIQFAYPFPRLRPTTGNITTVSTGIVSYAPKLAWNATLPAGNSPNIKFQTTLLLSVAVGKMNYFILFPYLIQNEHFCSSRLSPLQHSLVLNTSQNNLK